MSVPFDLVIRNADIATVADRYQADIGIRNGQILAIGRELARGDRELDAAGRLVTPGGIDGHCHLDQPMSDGSQLADDFVSGTRSAACGGTTTVIPFACQFKGQSLQAAVDDYHQRANGKAAIDYAFHLIVSDPSPTVLRQARGAGVDVPALARELEGVRRQNASCEVSSRVPGLAALAVPVFGAQGVVASITISGPVARWGLKRMRSFAGVAAEASRAISLALGGAIPRGSPETARQ